MVVREAVITVLQRRDVTVVEERNRWRGPGYRGINVRLVTGDRRRFEIQFHTHLYVDGGGRELAYVAMSRARQSTHVWTVADEAAQVVEDLSRDWSQRRAPTWAIDTGRPARQQPGVDPPDRTTPEHQIRLAAVVAAESAITAKALAELRRPDRREAIDQARRQLERVRQQRADLDHGRGLYHDTDAGRAVRDLSEAERAGRQARWEAEHAARWAATAGRHQTGRHLVQPAGKRQPTPTDPLSTRSHPPRQPDPQGREHHRRTARPGGQGAGRPQTGQPAHHHQEQAHPDRGRLPPPPRRHPNGPTTPVDPAARPRPPAVIPPHPASQPSRPGISM